MQALANMNQHDVNGNGWPGIGCYIDGYLCSVLFLDVFSLIQFPERAAHSKSAMIGAFLAVNTLPIAGSVFTVCVFKRLYYIILYNFIILKPEITYQTIYVAHRPTLVLRKSLNYC